MNTIRSSADLKMAIRQMELKQANELIVLKQDIKDTVEGMKPMNLIKGAFKKVSSNPDLKTDVLNAAIGLTTGFLTKKLVMGRSTNIFKKVLGIALEMTIANKVARNADMIKTAGNMVYNKFFNKKSAAPENMNGRAL
jgi:hypothetical protein